MTHHIGPCKKIPRGDFFRLEALGHLVLRDGFHAPLHVLVRVGEREALYVLSRGRAPVHGEIIVGMGLHLTGQQIGAAPAGSQHIPIARIRAIPPALRLLNAYPTPLKDGQQNVHILLPDTQRMVGGSEHLDMSEKIAFNPFNQAINRMMTNKN